MTLPARDHKADKHNKIISPSHFSSNLRFKEIISWRRFYKGSCLEWEQDQKPHARERSEVVPPDDPTALGTDAGLLCFQVFYS